MSVVCREEESKILERIYSSCEIKYINKPFVIDKQYRQILENKVKVFKNKTRTKKEIFVAMIASEGIKENIYSENFISKTVSIDDLFHDK